MKKACIIFFSLVLLLNSQGQNSFGAGISTAFFSLEQPGLELTPFVSFQHKPHEFIAGVELYDGSMLGFATIVGGELEYRYRFCERKHFNLYGNCDLSYVRFGSGTVMDVPFNYQNGYPPDSYWSMVQWRIFNNTFGIGCNFTFWNRLNLFVCNGVGYNFYRNNITPGADPIYVDKRFLDYKFRFSYKVRLGIAVRIFTKSAG